VASREPRIASFFQYVVAQYTCATARTANAAGRQFTIQCDCMGTNMYRQAGCYGCLPV